MVYVVTLEEREITGVSGETFICGVHQRRPSKERMKEYSKDYAVEETAFVISDDVPLEE